MNFQKSKQIFILFLVPALITFQTKGQEIPESPRIDCVVPLNEQIHKTDRATIWYDDFNGVPKTYAEGGSDLDSSMSFGVPGKSMLCF